MKRYTLTHIKKIAFDWGIILTSTEFVNSTTPLTWICPICNKQFIQTFERMKYKKHKCCSNCSNKKQHHIIKKQLGYSHEYVSSYIGKKGCKLMSIYEQDYTQPLKIECKCKNIFYRSFQTFKNSSSYYCNQCSNKVAWTTETVRQYVKNKGGILKTEYDPKTKIGIECPECCCDYSVKFQDFKNKKDALCPSCSRKKHNKRLKHEDVKKYFMTHSNCCLLENDFKNITTKLKIKCGCGEVYHQEFAVFRSRQFKECSDCSLKRLYGFTDEQLKMTYDKKLLYNLHHKENKTLGQISNQLGVSKQLISDRFKKFNIPVVKFANSAGEQEIYEFLCNYVSSDDIIQNDTKLISPYELDIFIPKHNIAIEFNGLYWHSEAKNNDRLYHKNKFVECESKNVQLITIYEDEWNNKQQIVQQMLLHKLHLTSQNKIFARSTQIKEVDKDEKRNFFDAFHIQGNGRSSINIGLFFNNTMVACVGLFKEHNDLVLNRFATSTHVVGGFSKLLKYIKCNYSYDQIITFSDNRYSTGNLYVKNGFMKEKELDVDYYYFYKGKRYHKFNMRKNKLKKLFNNYDQSLSERVNCLNNNCYRLWDCGKVKYIAK